MRWNTPDVIWPTAGLAEGDTELNAFDNALLSAGIGNLNLIKVSSVVPARARLLESRPDIEPGALVPCVYTSAVSSRPGESVAAAVGIGLRHGGHGMIFETRLVDREREPHLVRSLAEETVHRMVLAAFARRELQLDEVVVRSAAHRVERIGCAVAAVLLWWR